MPIPFYKTMMFWMIILTVVVLAIAGLLVTSGDREAERFIHDNHCKPVKRDDLVIADRILYTCDSGMTYSRIK